MEGGGCRVPLRDFPQGNFWGLFGKNETRKKRKNGKCRRKWGKMEKGRRKMRKK